MTRELPEPLADAVLAKLGLSRRPDPDLNALGAIYTAWCHRVPFDNMRKLLHVRGGNLGPLPGDTPADFFAHWLRFGTGGTCWAGNGALCALLGSLGFDARRAVGTMLAAPHLPPNHGSVTVEADGRRYIVDASILHGEPLLLDDTLALEETAAAESQAGWKVKHGRRDGQWFIRWRPLHKLDGLDCRIDEFDVGAAVFQRRHEMSRAWSPFNFELSLRVNRGDAVTGIGFGRRVDIDKEGRAVQLAVEGESRARFLIEEIGIHEEIALALPPDIPTPPPPSAPPA